MQKGDIDDGLTSGVSSDRHATIRRLEQENCELKNTNGILKRAESFFGAEPGRQHRM